MLCKRKTASYLVLDNWAEFVIELAEDDCLYLVNLFTFLFAVTGEIGPHDCLDLFNFVVADLSEVIIDGQSSFPKAALCGKHYERVAFTVLCRDETFPRFSFLFSRRRQLFLFSKSKISNGFSQF